jgi:light-regulated signal transduction histidine kinase (bacteriophytochrome)
MRRSVIFLFFGALAISGCLSGIAVHSIRSLLVAANWRTQALQSLIQLERLNATTQQFANELPNYLLTQKKEYRARFYEVEIQVDEVLEKLRQSIIDPAQQARLDSLKKLTDENFALLARMIKIRDAEGLSAAASIETGRLAPLAADIKRTIREISAQEEVRFDERDSKVNGQANFAIYVIIIGSFVSFLIVGFAALYVQREQRLQKQAAAALAQKTIELEESNRELESFSYSVSHDLRAPLRAVGGFADALIEDHAAKLDGEANRYLHLIADNSRKMGRLIDDLLAFSRLGRQEVRRSVIDMDKLIKDVLLEIGAASGRPLPPVSVQKLPPVFGDYALVRQVFLNLVSNAVKYSGKKASPLVEIGVKNADGENVYFVKDNGAGFDMRYAGKLFGVFQRLHKAEDFEGTGVGLAIVQRVVMRHGGRVWAEGRVNEGATFYLTFGKA